jgi:hypothetical protein
MVLFGSKRSGFRMKRCAQKLMRDRGPDLYNTTKALEVELPPKKKFTHHARLEKTHHLGYWRKYQNRINYTNYGCALALKLQNNMPLFELLAFHFKQSFQLLYEIYMTVDVPIRLGAWAR